MQRIDYNIPEFDLLQSSPGDLYYRGNRELLNKTKISIVGSRRPNQYTQEITFRLACELAKRDVCIVSGAAMGVDAISHKGAGAENTIAILPCGIDVRYPATNKKLIMQIEEKGLILSQFEPGFKAAPWSFVLRNELVVALGDILIITEADLNSGSMRSAEYAVKMGKEIYVLPHRLDESKGTALLLKQNSARVISDLDAFVERYGSIQRPRDAFLEFCAKGPSYEEALAYDAQKLFEYELLDKIRIVKGKISCR